MKSSQRDATPWEQHRETPLQRLVDDFLTSKQTGSGAYVASAGSELRRFGRWMEQRNAGLEDLDDQLRGQRLLINYAQRLQRRSSAGGISGSTANSYYAYISACLSYGVRKMELAQNPALNDAAKDELPSNEPQRREQQFWTPEQREQLVEHVRDRAVTAIDDRAFDAHVEARDRALVTLLAYSGVRGAEVLNHRKDDRDGRNGLVWSRVDLEDGTLYVRGKSKTHTEEKQWEYASLPKPARTALRQLKRIQRPPTAAWPVFETSHAPSLWNCARGELDQDVEALVEDHGSIREVLRTEGIEPPALTTDGARSLLKRLTSDAEIDLPSGADYLMPHGARRGIGEEVYRLDRGDAQDLLRHEDLSTTKDHYQHIDAAERTERVDELLFGEDS